MYKKKDNINNTTHFIEFPQYGISYYKENIIIFLSFIFSTLYTYCYLLTSQSERRMVIISVGLGLIYIATILIIIGLTTNNWKAIWDDNYHNRRIEVEFGLHRVCFRDADKCTNPYSNFDQSSEYLFSCSAE